MRESIKEITDSFKKGSYYIFRSNKKYYLYINYINQFYQIDEIAFETLQKIKVGAEINEKENLSFFKEWNNLDLGRRVSKNRKSIFRLFLDEENYDNMFFENLLQDPQNECLSIKNWEIVLELYSINLESSLDFFNKIILNIRSISDTFKIKSKIILKAPYKFYTDINSFSFITENKIVPIVQILKKEFTLEVVKDLNNLRIYNIDYVKNDFKTNDLHLNFKNFIKLNEPVTKSNFFELLNQINKKFVEDGETKVHESFQNIVRVFKYITSELIVQTLVNEGQNSLNKLPSSNSCNSCWAKNICWSSASYEAFGSSPYEVSKNSLNCLIIYRIIERCIDIISISQNSLFEKYNKKKELRVLEDGEILTFINP